MQRLSPLDAMLLQQDSPAVPRQIASLAILEPGKNGLDYDRLIHVINERIDLVPRYRQVPRGVGIGAPVWLDDENFDIAMHVRRSALPRPGSVDALHELVGRLIARRLDALRAMTPAQLDEIGWSPIGEVPYRGGCSKSARKIRKQAGNHAGS